MSRYNSSLFAWFIRMHDAYPSICKSTSSPTGCATSDTPGAEPSQIVLNGWDFRLKLDWRTLMSITADISVPPFSLFFRITTHNNHCISVEEGLLVINVAFKGSCTVLMH